MTLCPACEDYPCDVCPDRPKDHTWVRVFSEDGQHVVRVECSECHLSPYEVLLKQPVGKSKAPV